MFITPQDTEKLIRSINEVIDEVSDSGTCPEYYPLITFRNTRYYLKRVGEQAYETKLTIRVIRESEMPLYSGTYILTEEELAYEEASDEGPGAQYEHVLELRGEEFGPFLIELFTWMSNPLP